MNDDSFEMHAGVSRAVCKILGALVSIVAAVWAVYYLVVIGADETAEFAFGLFVVIFAPIVASALLGSAFGKIVVAGNHIQYRFLFRRRAFTFDDIARVELYVWQSRYGPTELFHIYLHGKIRHAVAVPKRYVNSNLLVARLKARNILGSDVL